MKKVGTTIKKPSVLKLSPELRELQGLMPMSGEDLLNLRTDIQNAGEVRDAIKVYQKGPDYLILCGAHRWEIADGLGLATVPVEIWEGSPKERRELVVGDNLNRRHLTAKQKAAIAEALFKNNPARSAREVAQKVNLDHKTAGKIKKALVGRGEIPHDEKVTDTRGRKQPATKPKKFKVPGPLDEGTFTLTDEGYTIDLDQLNAAAAELKREHLARAGWLDKIKVNDQTSFVDIMLAYLESLPDDNRRIELCQNIIKVCKSLAVRLQRPQE